MLSLQLQSQVFHVNLHEIPLNDYDLELGTEWLKALAAITWNLAERCRTFMWQNSIVNIQGLQDDQTALTSGKKINHMLQANSSI